MERHDMSVEFEVGDTPVRVLAGDRAREVLVRGVVVAAETWFTLVPSIRGGIQGNMEFCIRYEK